MIASVRAPESVQKDHGLFKRHSIVEEQNDVELVLIYNDRVEKTVCLNDGYKIIVDEWNLPWNEENLTNNYLPTITKFKEEDKKIKKQQVPSKSSQPLRLCNDKLPANIAQKTFPI